MTEQSRSAELADQYERDGYIDVASGRGDPEDDAEVAIIVTALREKAERDAAPIKAGDDLGNGLVAVPREPSSGVLMSMALRIDHALGCPGYYDTPLFGVAPSGPSHADILRVRLGDMRRAYEEVVGGGFYHAEKEAEYSAMIADAETGT